MNEQTETMNCDDYLKAIAAEPAETFAGGSAHAGSCESCRAERDRIREQDRRILAALEIPVPELVMPPLPGIDSEDKVVTLQPRRRISTPAWFGMAAGFALAAYFGLLLLDGAAPQLSLAEQVVAHLDHEAESRVVSAIAVPERTLQSVVSKDVAEMGPGIGLITYARSCVVNGKSIPHLVIQGANGPVTLLLMPDEPVDGPVTLEGVSINGVILPVGRGSIAIIGERDEALDDIKNRVIDSVKWTT